MKTSLKSFILMTSVLSTLISNQSFADGLFEPSSTTVQKTSKEVSVVYGASHIAVIDVVSNQGVPCVLAVSSDTRAGVAMQCDFTHDKNGNKK
jgi:hypothetical protein